MERKIGCYSNWPSFDCPETCPGGKSNFVEDGYGGEGYYVQICPNPETLGQPTGSIDYCGLGPDVIYLHRTEMPTDEEIREIAKDCWW